jgi:hypothetical protein
MVCIGAAAGTGNLRVSPVGWDLTVLLTALRERGTTP